MDTLEKVEAIESSGLMIAFDGCHKSYFCQTKEDEAEMRNLGYDLYPASELRSILDRSCGLVFVHPSDLGNHEWNIDQGELYEANYYGDYEDPDADIDEDEEDETE